MTRSKSTAAHFTVVEEIDVTELVALREKAKELGERARHQVHVHALPHEGRGARVSCAIPMLNGRLDEAAQEIVDLSTT